MTQKPQSKLTQGRLKELLTYEPLTGLFRWRIHRSRGARAGEPAGHVTSEGYVRITIDGGRYLAHRLAWLYMMGEWPAELVDHRDVNTGNNRWSNLRAATKSQNKMNEKTRRDNRTGLKGVHYREFVVYRNGSKAKRLSPFAAVIKEGHKQKTIGYFRTAEQAHAAYCERASQLFGEFARAA